MKKRIKRVFSLLIILCLILTQTCVSSVFATDLGIGEKASAVDSGLGERISGNDRYKTAVEISKKGWVSSQYAVIARGDDFADALCAGPLAKKYGAPILLTQLDKLNADTLGEIKRLGATHIIIVGGTGAISQNIENELKSAGIPDIERISGKDRYETSSKIAEKLGEVSRVAFVTGTNFPDALSFSAIATAKEIPILLTNKDSIPNCVKQYLAGKHINQSYIIGGTGAISDNVFGLVPNPLRIWGKDRFLTNIEVMKTFDKELNYCNVYIAVADGTKGDEFADALAGSVLAAKTSSPIILVNGSLADSTKNYIKTKLQLGSKVIALGGEAVVPKPIVDDVLSCVNEIPVSKVYDKAQTYGPKTGTDTVTGNALISVEDVILKNTVIEGDLILGQEIGSGNITLNNVTVKGKTIVRGGGPNSIVLINFNGGQIVVDIPDGHSVRLVAQGSTSVNSVTMNTNGKIEESNITGSGFADVVIPAGASVTLDGNFNNVDINSTGVKVQVNSGSIKVLNVHENAADASINLTSTAILNTMNIDAVANVTGTGTILQTNINSAGVTLAQKPVKVAVKNGITANVGGQQISGTANAGTQQPSVTTKEPTSKSITSVTLSNAKFIGLTEIVVDTNTQLEGITADNIRITKSDKSIVPTNKISNVKADAGKLTVDIDSDQFACISSIGTTIGTNAFGIYSAGQAVAVTQSGDLFTSDIWNKLTVANPGGDSMWHNITTDTAVKVDKTEYKGPDGSTYYKQIGKAKALMIVIDFPDVLAKDNTGVNGLPGKTPKDNGNMVNGHALKTAQDYYDYLMPRAHDFYNTSSYGQLDFDVTLVKSDNEENGGVFTCNGLLYGTNDANNNKAYALDRGGDTNLYVKDALNVAKSKLMDYPGGPYDIVYVVAAENAVGISYGPTDTWGGNANEWSGRTDLKALVRVGYDSYSTWKTKAVNHETGHDLGLVDYYINGFSGYGGGQCDPNTGTADYYPLVGHWNIMGYINGPAPDYMAWDKWRLGWIRDDQVDILTSKGTTVHQITPQETPGGTKLIVIPGPSKGIAYVIEYRQVAGVDNTANLEKSTDPDKAYQNSNWTHQYGTFNSPGILMYKIDFNVPTLSGPLTIVDLHPDDTTKELGTILDSSVMGATSGVYTYTDPAAGITIKLDKETESVDTLTINNNPPDTAVKPVLSEAKFIDLNTIEFKTNVDLRGIYKDSIVVKKGNSTISDVTINQITPKTMRITYGNGQFVSASETSNVTVSTNEFSYFGASDAVPVTPLTTLSGPVLSEAKFNSLTEIQAKSDVDLTGIGTSNIIIAKEGGSVVSQDKISNVKFDAESKTLIVTINADQFVSEDQTIGATIATTLFSTYKPAALNLQMAKYNPPVNVFDQSAATYIEPVGVKLQSIAIKTQANKTVYATGDTLDINGIVVIGTYDNASTHVIPITTANITGFDSSMPNDNQTLTVSIGEHTTSYTVAIKEKSQFVLQSIKITTPASKTLYAVGEKLDISDMVVKGVYAGNIEQILTITPANISGFDSTKVADNQVLTVTYEGQTVTYEVKIVVVSDNAYYKFLNKATKKVAEVNDKNVDQWWDYTSQYDATVAEWKFIDQRNGYYKIVNKGSLDSGYLEIKDGSTDDKATLVFNTNQPTDGSDLWSIGEVADGYYNIINKKSNKAIEVFDSNAADGAAIGQNTYTASDNQLWKITKLEQLTLNSLSITVPPAKAIYKIGDALDISGIEVKGAYSDNSQQAVIIKPEDVTGFDSSKVADDQQLTVTYGGKTANFNVTIKDPSQFALQSIEITTPPTKTVYNVGDELDISGMVVTGTYTGDVKQVVPVTTANITGFDSETSAVGQILTITCEGKMTTYSVTIKDLKPVSIAITKQPAKTIYLTGESLNIEGMVVTGTYNDDSKMVLPIETNNISGFDSSNPVDNQQLTVTYEGKTANFNVTIRDSSQFALQSIEITTPPTKTVYNVGDELDISGMVVTGTYTGDVKQVVPVTTANITGFDSKTPVAEQILTITCGEDITTSCAITILSPFTPDTTTPAYYKIINKNSGKVVEVNTADGGIVEGNSETTWKFEDKGNGYYKIGNSDSKYIDIWGGSSNDGAQMLLWGAYGGDDSEYWSIQPIDGTYCKIINKKSGKALDTDTWDRVVQNTYSGIDTQLWEIN